MFSDFIQIIILVMLFAVFIIICVVGTITKGKICVASFIAGTLIFTVMILFVMREAGGTQKYLVLARYDEAVVVQNLEDGSTTAFDVDKNSKVEAGDITIGKSGKVFIDRVRLSKAYMTDGDNDTTVTENTTSS